ncbi:hypothetical protein WJX84_011308 [Apatococcus fuscideae]|uniref:Uncharacterized protein n=1 Tax=Apatococcus fuscideae TaxID=2026836 RepID=A0AAW1SVJ3_9CHLO
MRKRDSAGMLQEGSAAQGAASDADSAASTEPPCPAVASAHCLPQGQSIIPGVLHRLQCAAHPADEQQLNTASSCSQDLLERDAPLLLLGLSEPPRQAATPHVACLTSGNPTCTSAGGQAISGTGHMLDRLPSTEMHPGAQPVRAEGPQVNVPAAVAARCVGTNDSGSMISADDAQSNEIPRHQSGSHAGVAGLQAYVALVPYSRTPSPCDATTTIRRPVASVPAEASPRVPSRMRYSATARKTAAMASSRVDRMVACEALFTDEDTPEMSHMDNLVPERPGVSSRKRHAKEAGVASQTRSVMPEQPEQAVPKAWVAPMEPLGKDARTAAACTGSRGVAGALMRQSKRPRSAASQWSASPAKPHVAIHADNGCNGLEPERADLASGTPPSDARQTLQVSWSLAWSPSNPANKLPDYLAGEVGIRLERQRFGFLQDAMCVERWNGRRTPSP